jgi:ferredoxin
MTGARVIERRHLDALFAALARRGYTIVGPTVRDGAIVYDTLSCAAELPAGWTDEQEAGHYRLVRRDDEALFGYAVGPHSLKQLQLPAARLLWRAQVGPDGGLCDVSEPADRPARIAFLGARSCELHAREILERVLLGGSHPDPGERSRADALLMIAVQCGQAGGTCFCVSMGTGPEVRSGYDVLLTEILEPGPPARHYFLAESGGERGAELLADLPSEPAGEGELAAGRATPARAAAQMGRTLDTDGLKELLYRNYEHPRWQDVADRCLTCGNCTMVCPTCFCTTVEDVTDLTGEQVERHQRWDSCFTVDYSHIHGGAVRGSARSRYRQWMTHKLASWVDQFGTSGCVGCGRCITWCPVGIDITAEAGAIRAGEEQDDAHAG